MADFRAMAAAGMLVALRGVSSCIERQKGRMGAARARKRFMLIGLGLLLGGGLAAAWLDGQSWPVPALAARQGPAVAGIKSWQPVADTRAPGNPGPDLIVVDMMHVAGAHGSPVPEAVARLRRRASGAPRLVLAHLPIATAEPGQFYWWRHWSWLPPSWLERPAADGGGHPVNHLDPRWQRILFAGERTLLDTLLAETFHWRKPYLDRIIEANFDGVYLTGLDTARTGAKPDPEAAKRMAALVIQLSSHAKRVRPGFLVVAENGEALTQHETFVKAVDAIARSRLLYGTHGGESENTSEEVMATTSHLNRAHNAGLPVLVIERLADPAKQRRAQSWAAELGYLLALVTPASPAAAMREASHPPVHLAPVGR